MRENRTKRSDTACIHCRTQKIRCSKEVPSCGRCAQRDQQCHYPRPPDRKALALQRARPNNPCLPHSNCIEFVHHTAPPMGFGPPSFARQLNELEKKCRIAEKRNDISRQHIFNDNDLEPETGIFLIEVYFTHLWTASLVFDYQSLITDYRAGDVPGYLLFSIFAISSLFLKSGSGNSLYKSRGLSVFAFLGDRGRTWADWASQSVLREADKPSLSKIRACELLALYWFAVGEHERATVHAAISRESCHILTQRSKVLRKCSAGLTKSEYEVPVRLRVAVWLKTCMLDNGVADETKMSDLGLSPIDISSLSPSDENASHSTDTDSSRGSVDWMAWNDQSQRSQNSALHALQLFSLWREVRLLVQSTLDSEPTVSYVAAAFEISARIEKEYAEIPLQLKDDHIMSGTYSEKTQANALFLRSVYCLALIYLLGSVVPAFSGAAINPGLPHTLALSCAKTVLEKANKFCEILRIFLSRSPDLSKVPSFVSYAAFMAGSVQAVITTLHSKESRSLSHDRATLCLLFLEESKTYYPTIEGMRNELSSRVCATNDQWASLHDTALQELLLSSAGLDPNDSSPPPQELFDSLEARPSTKTFLVRTFFDHAASFNATLEQDHDDRLPLPISRDGPEMTKSVDLGKTPVPLDDFGVLDRYPKPPVPPLLPAPQTPVADTESPFTLGADILLSPTSFQQEADMEFQHTMGAASCRGPVLSGTNFLPNSPDWELFTNNVNQPAESWHVNINEHLWS